MKVKETKKVNLKVTMTYAEAEVIASILSHVRLGSSTNSDAVLDFLTQMEPYVQYRTPVAFEYNEDEGHIINV